MTQWIRYRYQGQVSLGKLDASTKSIQPYAGNMFENPIVKDEKPLGIDEVKLLTPTEPSKLIALWNNYGALATEKNLTHPQTPLYLMKPPNTYLACNENIKHPKFYQGDVFFEGELGIVIGQKAKDLASLEQGKECIFGYTCINDVTAFGLLKEDAHFDQWTRAKGFDTFGVMGPAIACDLRFEDLLIQTFINGKEVQNYPASDMLLPPNEVVMLLSRNMSLMPGDIICCGTSVGLGPMPRGCEVKVSINGIGSLVNRYID